MATIGLVTLLVASLLPMLCSVVAAPMSPNDFLNRLARPFDSVSNALHSNTPAEHELEYVQDDFGSFAGHQSGWQALLNPTAREHNAINAAATNHGWQGGASHYSPTMTSNDLFGGASSSRGGAGPSSQHPHPNQLGFQHQPSALIGPGSGSYGVVESRLQHQRLSDPDGGDSYKLNDLLLYTPEQIDDMASVMNSPDVSALPRSHAVQADAPRDAAADSKRRKSKGRLKDTSAEAQERADAHRAAQTKLDEAIQATYDDLLNYSYLWEKGDPILEPALALGWLTDKDLVRHAEIAFQEGKTALQTRLGPSSSKPGVLNYVHATDHQRFIVQELINRRLKRFASPIDRVTSIRIWPWSDYYLEKGNIKRALEAMIRTYEPATQGTDGAPRTGNRAIRYDTPFMMGEYTICVLGKRFDYSVRPVFAIAPAALNHVRSGLQPPRKPMEGNSGRPFRDEQENIFLGYVNAAPRRDALWI